jgi:hypothetical protein
MLMSTGQMLSIAIVFPLVLSRIPEDVMFHVFLFGGGMSGAPLAAFESDYPGVRGQLRGYLGCGGHFRFIESSNRLCVFALACEINAFIIQISSCHLSKR